MVFATTKTNMLAVALKGVFLIGLISWYSVAIMSMINDYFRTEFKEYLKSNPIASPKADQMAPATVIASPTQQHIENGKLFESFENNGQRQKTETNELLRDGWSAERIVGNGKMHCDHVKNKEAILMRLFGKGLHSYDVCVIDSSVNGWIVIRCGPKTDENEWRINWLIKAIYWLFNFRYKSY